MVKRAERGPFRIDKAVFEQQLRPQLGSLDPRTLIQFPVLLPFHMPVQGVLALIFSLESDAAMGFLFEEVTIHEAVPAGVLVEKSLKIPRPRTRVEMAFLTKEEERWDDAREAERVGSMHATLEKLIEGLNKVLAGYLLSTWDFAAHEVTLEMLGTFFLGRLVPLRDWEKAVTGVWVVSTPTDPAFPSRRLDPRAADEWTRLCRRLSLGGDPLLIVTQVSLSAVRQLGEGRFSEAVVYAQMAVESFVAFIYAGLCAASGEEVRDDISFMTMLKTQVAGRLAAQWDFADAAVPPGRWYQKTYALRNQVVHRARSVTRAEAADAVAAAEDFLRFVAASIRRKRGDYPELASQLAEFADAAPNT